MSASVDGLTASELLVECKRYVRAWSGRRRRRASLTSNARTVGHLLRPSNASRFAAIEDTTLDGASPELQQHIRDCLDRFRELMRVVQLSGGFSRNEEFADVRTHDIPFMSLEYYCAQLLRLMHDPSLEPGARLHRLEACRALLASFVDRARDYGLLHASDKAAYARSRPLDHSANRTEKIERARRAKAARASFARLAKRFAEAVDDPDEETHRELYRAELEGLVIKALDELDYVDQELSMLAHMAISRKAPEDRTPAEARQLAAVEAKRAEPIAPLRPIRLTPRDIAQLKVFGDPNRPTISIEEWADMQLAKGAIPSAASACAADPGAAATAAAVAEDAPVLDPQDESEADTVRKRQWDDWKDAHPAGSGNTMARIG